MAMGEIPQAGQHIVIIGAGNVALDAARSLLRLGKDVTIVYRREKNDMPANAIEILESEEEKDRLLFSLFTYRNCYWPIRAGVCTSY